MHRATCRQSIDEWGDRWHSAACEGGGANYRYALAFSGDKRYARSIAAWVTP